MKHLQISFTVKMQIHKLSFFKKWHIVFLLVALLLAISLISICMGAVGITPMQVLQSFFSSDTSGFNYRIIMFIRLPRTLAAILSGSALAVAGAIIQAVLCNPLAGPNIIGVNSGAGFFALLCCTVFPSAVGLVPLAAFLGALAASMTVYFIARKTGASRITLILAGVAVSGILSAGIDTLTTLYPNAVIGANAFMLGGLAGVTLKSLQAAGIYILIGIAAAFALSYELDLLELGDDTALSLGLNVKTYRFILLAIASALAGAAVSFAGLLGFVGLIIPHAARLIVGRDNRYLVPASALLGAIFVTCCDILARVLFAPFELPVGIIMSFIGGPFFVYLLLKQRGGRLHD